MTTLSRDEKLVLLMEECGEVIQAATKCLRFGFDSQRPSYDVNSQPSYKVNNIVLANEIGDLLGVVDALNLNPADILTTRSSKMLRAERAKALYGSGK